MLFVIKVFNIAKLSLYEPKKYQIFVRFKSSFTVMKVLNVAEKNDAAKSIAGYLSRGCFKRVFEVTLIEIYDKCTNFLYEQYFCFIFFLERRIIAI